MRQQRNRGRASVRRPVPHQLHLHRRRRVAGQREGAVGHGVVAALAPLANRRGCAGDRHLGVDPGNAGGFSLDDEAGRYQHPIELRRRRELDRRSAVDKGKRRGQPQDIAVGADVIAFLADRLLELVQRELTGLDGIVRRVREQPAACNGRGDGGPPGKRLHFPRPDAGAPEGEGSAEVLPRLMRFASSWYEPSTPAGSSRQRPRPTYTQWPLPYCASTSAPFLAPLLNSNGSAISSRSL